MRVNRMELVRVLTLLRQVCPKEIKGSSDHLVACSSARTPLGMPSLVLFAWDAERKVALSHEISVLGGPYEEFSCYLEPKKLSQLLRKGGKGLKEVTLRQCSPESFYLGLGDQEVKVQGPPLEALLPLPNWTAPREDEELERIAWDAQELYEIVDFVIRAMSPDLYRPHLHGMLFSPLDVVATDGHRLHKVEGPPQWQGDPVLLNGFAMMALHRQLKSMGRKSETVWLTASGGHARFSSPLPTWDLVTCPVDERFPPYDKVIPNYTKHHVNADAAELLKAVELVMSVREEGDCVQITANGKLTVSDGEDVAVEVPSRQEIEHEVTLGFHGRYLVDALTGAGPSVNLKFNGFSDGMLVEPQRKHLAVVMPMRI